MPPIPGFSGLLEDLRESCRIRAAAFVERMTTELDRKGVERCLA
jgi:hypothetical protein